jgi:hypothetical protein
METLRQAYGLAKENDGAPGVDGVTFEVIEAQEVEAFVEQIRDELVERTYKPLPARKRELPKDGGKVRVLSIPALRDRVVQRKNAASHRRAHADEAREQSPTSFAKAYGSSTTLRAPQLRFRVPVGEWNADRLPQSAAELVRLDVGVMAAAFTPYALAAKGATTSIPIVIISVGDPIAAGLDRSTSGGCSDCGGRRCRGRKWSSRLPAGRRRSRHTPRGPGRGLRRRRGS